MTKDELWKSIIEDLFEEFLHFFYPNFVQEVDLKRGYKFLDKELQALSPDADTIKRRADLLVRVYLKSGVEKWLLIHIEVQGYEDATFPLRMFTYYYRSFDKYGMPIVGMAIFTDANKNYQPSFYKYKMWDTELIYRFKSFKVLENDVEYYLNIDNPFAVVLAVVRSSLNKKNIQTDESLLALKTQLFRRMYEKGYKRKQIINLASFIKYYVQFRKKVFIKKLDEKIESITGNQKTMGIVELVKRHQLNEAKKEGARIKAGELEKAAQKAAQKAARISIEKLLKKDISVEMTANLLDFSVEKVQTIKKEMLLKEQIKELLEENKTVAEIIAKLKVSDELMQDAIEESKLNQTTKE